MAVTVDDIVEATGGIVVSGPRTRTFAHLFTDSRRVEPGGLFVALKGEERDGHAFIADALGRGAAGILCETPPAPAPGAVLIRVPDTRQALFAMTRDRLRRQGVPIVGITGSSGKTTTKDLIAHVLGSRVHVHKSAGNLNTYTGIPMTVFEMDPRTRVLVMEYAMSRAGEIHELTSIAAPTIGVVLNVGLAHVGLLGSIDAVQAAKRELVEGLAPQGVAILNGDDPRVRTMASAAPRAVLYGFASDALIRGEDVQLAGLSGSKFRLRTPKGDAYAQLSLPGRHSVSNALAAAAVAIELGFRPVEVAESLRGFRPPDGRLVVVRGRRGATIIDDTYNANPGSMRAALEVLGMAPKGSLRIAVLGDMLELGEEAANAHEEIGRLAVQHADRLIAMGEQAERMVLAARRAGMDESAAIAVGGPDQAVERVEPLLGPAAQVLVKGSRGMRMERVVTLLREVA